MPVFLAVVAVPLIEIALFVILGSAIGVWGTLAFVFCSTAFGVAILRRGGRIGRSANANPLMQLAGSGLSLFAAILLGLRRLESGSAPATPLARAPSEAAHE